MKDSKFILLETNGKVYFTNKENEEKLKNEEFKVYSTNKDFILVYSEDDLEKIYQMNIFDSNYENTKSTEDRIYDNFLEEFEIDKNTSKDWFYVSQKVDKTVDTIIEFHIKGKLETKANCLFSKKDCIKEGAKVIYGYRANPPHEDIFVTVAIGRKYTEGDEKYA